MIELAIAALGLGSLGLSFLIGDGDDFPVSSNDDVDADTDALAQTEELNPQIFPETSETMEALSAEEHEETESFYGVVAMWNELVDGFATDNDDVIGVGYDRTFDRETGEFLHKTASVHAGGGNDYLYVLSGTAAGDEGDDTITAYYDPLVSDEHDLRPVLLGGAGDDVINIGNAKTGVVDAGQGNDIVYITSRFESDFNVTLGDGQDTIRYVEHAAPGHAIVTLSDFDPSQDSIDIIRTSDYRDDAPDAFSGFDVHIEPESAEGMSKLSIALQMADPNAEPEVYEFLVYGLDASQIDEIDIQIRNEIDTDDESTVVKPNLIGKDLIYNIPASASEGLYLEAVNFDSMEENQFRNVERIVLNVEEEFAGQIYVQEFVTQAASANGTFGVANSYLAILRGPEAHEGGPMVAYNAPHDDTTILSADGVAGHLGYDAPEFLAPYELLGTFGLQSTTWLYGDAQTGENTERAIEVAINRV